MFSPAQLSRHAELGETRAAVRAALEALSEDDDAAAKALHLGVKSRAETRRNRELGTAGTMPAIERYTGVLFDALDVFSLEPAAREWITGHVSIQSALFGLIAADDRIPAYRLSASTRLPALGSPLAKIWRSAHAGLDWGALGWTLDLRSKDYAALAPLPHGRGVFVEVVERGDDGEVRALNHFNKAAKGALVRRLADSGARLESTNDLIVWAKAEQIEISASPDDTVIMLVTER